MITDLPGSMQSQTTQTMYYFNTFMLKSKRFWKKSEVLKWKKYKKQLEIFGQFYYIILTVLTLAVLPIKPLKEFLGQLQIGFAFPEMVTGYGFRDAAADPFSPIALSAAAAVGVIMIFVK